MNEIESLSCVIGLLTGILITVFVDVYLKIGKIMKKIKMK
jgi:hypothetical protein